MLSKPLEGYPVEISPSHLGQIVRRAEMYVELGGPEVPYKFELLKAYPKNEVEDGKVEILGVDLPQLAEGGSYPIGIYVRVHGEKVDEDLEPVIERRIHECCNYIEGFMHQGQRSEITLRLSKASYLKGLNSLRWIGLALIKLLKAEFPIVDRVQVTFLTDVERIKTAYEDALKVYEKRNARARTLKDEDVDSFYGCTLCQSFAPTHVCVITPSRTGLCGAVTWFDAKASAQIDPKGPNFKIIKGECLDPVRGEYGGVNDAVKMRSGGRTERVYLHSMFGYPHTSCGCFEAIAFYIPEVDGIGIVHRDFTGPTVNAMTFPVLAGQTGGGAQIEGFLGISIEYMRSPKFLQADGGWSRVVWMPSKLKEALKNSIPERFYDRIATEKDVANIDELLKFLQEKKRAIEIKPPEEVPAPVVSEVHPTPAAAEALTRTDLTSPAGITIVLKGVKIRAERMIIRRGEREDS